MLINILIIADPISGSRYFKYGPEGWRGSQFLNQHDHDKKVLHRHIHNILFIFEYIFSGYFVCNRLLYG